MGDIENTDRPVRWIKKPPTKDGWYRCLIPNEEFGGFDEWFVEVCYVKKPPCDTGFEGFIVLYDGDTYLLSFFNFMVLWWGDRPEKFAEPPEEGSEDGNVS